MDKTIETTFFEPFRQVVDKCFEWMKQRYDLGYKFDETAAQKPQEQLTGKWRQYYDEVLPKEIDEAAAAFDDSVLPPVADILDTPLMQEIAKNLDECKNDKQAERYIISLLKPFKIISDKLNPTAEIKKLKGETPPVVGIKQRQRALERWQQVTPDEQGYKEAQEQAEACRWFIKRDMWQIKRAKEVANRYCDLLCRYEDDARWMQKGTVEHNLSGFVDIAGRFGDALDALLLERGINLLWYQQQSGIYLIPYRDITTLEMYCGSMEIATKYIDEALPKLTEEAVLEQQPTLPKELATDEAKAILSKAVAQNILRVANGKYIWNGTNALLAYFCGRLWCGDEVVIDNITKEEVLKRGSGFFPEAHLQLIFCKPDGSGLKNLGQSRRQLDRLPKGHEPITQLFK